MKEIKVGIIAAPELSTEIAQDIKDKLSTVFNQKIDSSVSWNIQIVTDGLTSVAEDSEELVNGMLKRRRNKDWDYTLSLTDIPIFYNKQAVLAEVNFNHKLAVLSLPSLGWFALRRIVPLFLEVTRDLYLQQKNAQSEKKHLSQLFLLNSIQKNWDKAANTTRYLFQSKLKGLVTILTGMTYDNQPWTIMYSLKSTIAIAFGSGVYGMIFPTLWKISYHFSSGRMTLFMLWTIIGLGLWIIQGHSLWERKTLTGNNQYRRLYNAATVTTLLVAISMFYFILFLLFLITSFVFVDPQFFAEQLELSVLPSLCNYLQLAWLTTSVGMITGAVGVGLEDEENVRKTTYGYRQQERYKAVKKERKKEENTQE